MNYYTPITGQSLVLLVSQHWTQMFGCEFGPIKATPGWLGRMPGTNVE